MHRYLVSFDPKRVPHHFTDILIIGAGIAGIRAALAVPPELDVLVVTKDHIRESNSTYAQGGIASAFARGTREVTIPARSSNLYRIGISIKVCNDYSRAAGFRGSGKVSCTSGFTSRPGNPCNVAR